MAEREAPRGLIACARCGGGGDLALLSPGLPVCRGCVVDAMVELCEDPRTPAWLAGIVRRGLVIPPAHEEVGPEHAWVGRWLGGRYGHEQG